MMEKDYSSSVNITSVVLTKNQADSLNQLIRNLPLIIEKLNDPTYDEIFGYRINQAIEPYVNVPVRNEILLKFLVANDFDVGATSEHLIKTLNWRCEMKPLTAAYDEKFNLMVNLGGAATRFDGNKPNNKTILWCFYRMMYLSCGRLIKWLPSPKYGIPDSHIRWLVALIEKSVQLLDLTDADNNMLVVIQDFQKTTKDHFGLSSKMESILSNYYPVVNMKFLVNVPKMTALVGKRKAKYNNHIFQEEAMLEQFFPLTILYSDLSYHSKLLEFLKNEEAWKEKHELPRYGHVIVKKLPIEQFNLYNVSFSSLPHSK